MKGDRRNEISAREGIDTISRDFQYYQQYPFVEMRYQPERALTRFFRGVSGFTIPIVENASSACPRQKTSKRKIKETIKKPFSDVPHQERLPQRKDKVKEKTNA